MDNLPADTRLYNEYHALIVRVGKEHCRKKSPLCNACPLRSDAMPGIRSPIEVVRRGNTMDHIATYEVFHQKIKK